MEFTETDKKKFKELLMKTMKAFVAFCDAHQLTYYGCAGTALGAVRHAGLIPWDDDIDVVMPRKDYDRMMGLRNTLLGTDYELMDINTPFYYLNFAKFCDSHTTLWESEERRCMLGVYVDIFPLDYAENTPECRTKYRNFFNDSLHLAARRRRYTFRSWLSIAFRDPMHFLKTPLYMFRRLYSEDTYARFKASELAVLEQRGPYHFTYAGRYAFEKELHPAEWFAEGRMVPFEDIQIRIPKEAERYLTCMFGDYMTLPPLEKRISHHSFYFFDLDRRYTLEEAKRKVRTMDRSLLKQRDISWYQRC